MLRFLLTLWLLMATYNIDTTSGVDTTGNGSAGSPYKSLQFALNDRTQGASGDIFQYINSTADDVLSATLSLTHYGTPAAGKPLTIQGSGIIGAISGNSGGFTILTSSGDVGFLNMHLHHCGASALVNLSSSRSFLAGCEADHSTSGAAAIAGLVANCYLHDSTGSGAISATIALNNYLDLRSGSPSTQAIYASVVIGNAIALASGAGCRGIILNAGGTARGNAVFGNGGTGQGIWDGGSNGCFFIDNVIEGFNGTGGIGLRISGNTIFRANNRMFNCATTASITGTVYYDLGTDATDSSTNFNNAAGGDLTLKSGSPAISTSSRPAGYPGTYNGSSYKSYADQGAFQYPPSAGGGASPNSGMRTGGRL